MSDHSGRILEGATFSALSGDISSTAGGVVTVTDLSLTSEARGDIARRGASVWARLSAKTAGQVLLGDGTDVISAPLSGDVSTVSSAGAVTLADPHRVYTSAVPITATQIVGNSAGALAHASGVTLVAGSASKVIVPIMVVVAYTRVTASYTTDVNLSLNYSSSGSTQEIASSNYNSNTLFTSGSSATQIMIPATTNGVSGGNVVGADFVMKGSASITQPGTAAGTATLTTYYHLVTP